MINISTQEIVMYPDGRIDTRNASAYTGLSEKTMAMMRCNGTGPKFIKRGRIFYFKEDLDYWLSAGGRLTSTAQAQQKNTQCLINNYEKRKLSKKRFKPFKQDQRCK